MSSSQAKSQRGIKSRRRKCQNVGTICRQLMLSSVERW
jgi:hypothetical protein